MSTEDKKIICYSIDDKTYRSLELQFKREYVYSVVLSKILKELNKK